MHLLQSLVETLVFQSPSPTDLLGFVFSEVDGCFAVGTAFLWIGRNGAETSSKFMGALKFSKGMYQCIFLILVGYGAWLRKRKWLTIRRNVKY